MSSGCRWEQCKSSLAGVFKEAIGNESKESSAKKLQLW